MKSLLVSVAAFCALLSASEANAVTLNPGNHLFIQFDTPVAPDTGEARVNVSPIGICPGPDICSMEVQFSTGSTFSLTGVGGLSAARPITASEILSALVVIRGERSVSVEAFTTVFEQATELGPLIIEVREGSLPPGFVSAIPLPATIPLFLSALGLLFIGGWKRKIIGLSGSPKPSDALAV